MIVEDRDSDGIPEFILIEDLHFTMTNPRFYAPEIILKFQATKLVPAANLMKRKLKKKEIEQRLLSIQSVATTSPFRKDHIRKELLELIYCGNADSARLLFMKAWPTVTDDKKLKERKVRTDFIHNFLITLRQGTYWELIKELNPGFDFSCKHK